MMKPQKTGIQWDRRDKEQFSLQVELSGHTRLLLISTLANTQIVLKGKKDLRVKITLRVCLELFVKTS